MEQRPRTTRNTISGHGSVNTVDQIDAHIAGKEEPRWFALMDTASLYDCYSTTIRSAYVMENGDREI